MNHNPKKLLPSVFNRDFPDYLFHLPTLSDFEGIFKNVEKSDQGLTVYEKDNQFIVEAAVPGLDNSGIEININKGVLWIKGEKKETESDKDKKYYRRSYSSFSYSVALPEQIDDKEEPEATYENGILKIEFKKAKSNEAKRISIKTNK